MEEKNLDADQRIELIQQMIRGTRQRLSFGSSNLFLLWGYLLAATATEEAARNQVYNVAVSGRTTLNTLFNELKGALAGNCVSYEKEPVYRDFRAGDVRHSQADISKIQNLLGYGPEFDIETGIAKAMPWYKRFLA